MPPKATDESLADAVIQNVEFGRYPDSEDVISAELPASSYPQLLASIEKARNEVKEEVRALSKGAAPDVDTWIAQAKQLQADIERSKATAQDIVQQAGTGKKLQAAVTDATSKAQLLTSELAFNESLASTLEKVKSISGTLDSVQAQIVQEDLVGSIDGLEVAVDAAKELSLYEDTRFTSLLHDRIARLGAEVREHTIQCWDHVICVDKSRGSITVQPKVQEGPTHGIDAIADALSRLNVRDDAVEKLFRGLEIAIINKWLSKSASASTIQLYSEGNTLKTNDSRKTSNVEDKLSEAKHLLDFLHARLPQAVCFSLSERLIPVVSYKLIDEWLTPAVPLSVDGIDSFQSLLDHTLELAEHIKSLELFGANLLSDWVEEAPRIWLTRRKEAALASIRASCFKGLRTRIRVERVETQMVSNEQQLLNPQEPQEHATEKEDDDWNDNWDEEHETSATAGDQEADEDTSAWDVGDEAGDEPVAEPEAASATEEESGDAWGWGDGDNASQPASPVATRRQVSTGLKTNGIKTEPKPSEREVTLRESYTVTSIPDNLMDLVVSLINDAEKLSDPKFIDSPIAPAARGLYSIPPLVLGMYRATAAAYYAKDPAGNMLLYNDCSRLSEQLSKLAADSANSGIGRLRLDSDINLLNRFGKLAYGREMESQRTILRDLLDGAQSFTNCTVQPFAMECEGAVAMTVDRVRDVKTQWQGILSTSAMLQSLGNLVSTVCAKVIVDIEEMADISEDESKALSSYISKIGTISDVFSQSSPDGSGEQVDMTGVYTPNWFKFQYLGEILESRLADIKYLWQEGELSLEFELGEVVDLIEALFADSEYRRGAIREIRATQSHH